MSRLLKLAVPIFSVCFSLSVSAARPQLPPAWDGSSVRFDSRTYGYMPPVRIVAQEQADLISGGDLLLEAGNGQADLFLYDFAVAEHGFQIVADVRTNI